MPWFFRLSGLHHSYQILEPIPWPRWPKYCRTSVPNVADSLSKQCHVDPQSVRTSAFNDGEPSLWQSIQLPLDAWTSWLAHWIQRCCKYLWDDQNHSLQVLYGIWLCWHTHDYLPWRKRSLAYDDEDGRSENHHPVDSYQERSARRSRSNTSSSPFWNHDAESNDYPYFELDN